MRLGYTLTFYMRCANIPFLGLLLLSFLTIAQTGNPLKQLPYSITIGGRADSLTIEEIITAGKPVSSHPAFEIISFKTGFIGSGTPCFSETDCPDGLFSGMALSGIRHMEPGSRMVVSRIRVKNKIGQEFLLKDQVFRIRVGKK
ncbi:hypothetical protein [Paraflavitalea sp. CAU 1676]|uniref:hypothetical protein n=1 Tax=Paraflavitalea sp. CAU 1676 TaxID=3032598 RepID=UPI0023DC2961|nr:hypothetical protein [Paraflavitalea sp. CAU 1676]MDF2190020.1 hypothetical protein [Paraflavitalea sp. CAU 1676]